MAKEVIIRSHRDGYSISQVESTMTIGQLMSYLERFPSDAKLYVSHDGGYMFSGVREDDFIER